MESRLAWQDMGTEYLYHGTSRAIMEKILASGAIKPPSWWGTEQVAEYYAVVAAEAEGKDDTDSVIFQVPLSRFNGAMLKPDGNSIAEPLTFTLGRSEEDLYEEWEASKGTWQECLEIYESVRYNAPMKVTGADIP